MHHFGSSRGSRRGYESIPDTDGDDRRPKSKKRDVWRSMTEEKAEKKAQERKEKAREEAPYMLRCANEAKDVADRLITAGNRFTEKEIDNLILSADKVKHWIKGNIEPEKYEEMRNDYNDSRYAWQNRTISMFGGYLNEHVRLKEKFVRDASAFLEAAAQEISLLATEQHYAQEGPSGFAGVQVQHYAQEGPYEQPHPVDQ